jgi:hypothetical protein
VFPGVLLKRDRLKHAIIIVTVAAEVKVFLSR